MEEIAAVEDFDACTLSVLIDRTHESDEMGTVVIVEINDGNDVFMNSTITVEQWRALVARVERSIAA